MNGLYLPALFVTALLLIAGCSNPPECEPGLTPCCDEDGRLRSTDYVCDSWLEYRCSPEGECGANAQYRVMEKHCNGEGRLCYGLEEEPQTFWLPLENCGVDKICTTDGETFAECATCAIGCHRGTCSTSFGTECDEGECCDPWGHFRSTDFICSEKIEYRCSDNGCGSNAKYRTIRNFCNGYSDYCYSHDVPGEWRILETCDSNQVCISDEDSYSECMTCELGCHEGFCAPTLASIDSGRNYNCGIFRDYHTNRSSVFCWGGSSVIHRIPESVKDNRARSVSTGDRYACAISSPSSGFRGSISCWGDDNVEHLTPPDGDDFKEVRAGWSHACAIRQTGELVCWGSDEDGQSTVPLGDEAYRNVDVGLDHTCAVTTHNHVACWGKNTYGQASPPEELPGRAVTCGENFSCLLGVSEEVTCWGTFFLVSETPTDEKFEKISAGSQHVCGITTEGTAVCWGSNSDGQASPPPGTYLMDISSGGEHTCGLRHDGSVLCWGNNELGQAEYP